MRVNGLSLRTFTCVGCEKIQTQIYSHQQQRAKAKVMLEWLSYLALEIIREQCFWSKSCLILTPSLLALQLSTSFMDPFFPKLTQPKNMVKDGGL
jgi:hypothetical protein